MRGTVLVYHYSGLCSEGKTCLAHQPARAEQDWERDVVCEQARQSGGSVVAHTNHKSNSKQRRTRHLAEHNLSQAME